MRHVRERCIERQIELRDIGLALHEQNGAGNLTDRAFHFRVTGMADQDQRAARRDVLAALHMNLRDERAGGVEHVEVAFLGGAFYGLGHAVGAENRHGAFWHFVELFHETRALVAQVFDHVTVVDDLMAHVDGRAVFLQCAINDFDSADNPRTKAAGLGKDHSHRVANSDCRRR